jgi:hypothetical protein
MVRILLTFLALLTGLVAQVSPAQTMLRGGESEIGVTLGSVRAEQRAAPSTRPDDGVKPGQPDDRRCTILMRVPQQDCFPATYIGSDRSLD